MKSILPSSEERLRNFQPSPDDGSFIISTEISFIYSKKGTVRKVHLLLLAPDFDSVDKINGRPILGMDEKAFVKMIASVCPGCIVIPAHIWTPWF